MKNKWWFFLILFLSADVAGQAVYYFISGESERSSSLRDFLVFLQFIFGLLIAFYAWKKLDLLNHTKV